MTTEQLTLARGEIEMTEADYKRDQKMKIPKVDWFVFWLCLASGGIGILHYAMHGRIAKLEKMAVGLKLHGFWYDEEQDVVHCPPLTIPVTTKAEDGK